MGNNTKQPEDYQVVRNYHQEDWLKYGFHNRIQLWKNKLTNRLAEVHRLYDFPTVEQMEKYQFRHRSYVLVKVFGISLDRNQSLCTRNDNVQLLIEHIPFRLNNVNGLSIQQSLTILKKTLTGFEFMDRHFESVEPKEELIGFNQFGQCKIWLNRALELNKPEKAYFLNYENDNIKITSKVRKIFDLIEQKTYNKVLPFSLKEQFRQKNPNYNEAIEILQIFAQNEKIRLDTNLNHLGINIMHSPNQSSQINTNNQTRFNQIRQPHNINQIREHVPENLNLRRVFSLSRVENHPHIYIQNKKEIIDHKFKISGNATSMIINNQNRLENYEKPKTRISFVHHSNVSALPMHLHGVIPIHNKNLYFSGPINEQKRVLKENKIIDLDKKQNEANPKVQSQMIQNQSKYVENESQKQIIKKTDQLIKSTLNQRQIENKDVQDQNKIQNTQKEQIKEQIVNLQQQRSQSSLNSALTELNQILNNQNQQSEPIEKEKLRSKNSIIQKIDDIEIKQQDKLKQEFNLNEQVLVSAAFNQIDNNYEYEKQNNLFQNQQAKSQTISKGSIQPQKIQDKNHNELEINFQSFAPFQNNLYSFAPNEISEGDSQFIHTRPLQTVRSLGVINECKNQNQIRNTINMVDSQSGTQYLSKAEQQQYTDERQKKNENKQNGQKFQYTPVESKFIIKKSESIPQSSEEYKNDRISAFGALQDNQIENYIRNKYREYITDNFINDSLKIDRVDSLYQKTTSEKQAIVVDKKQNKYQEQQKIKLKKINNQNQQNDHKEQDFLDVNFMEKSLHLKFNSKLKNQTQRSQKNDQDDILNIAKLEEGLLKFSESKISQNKKQNESQQKQYKPSITEFQFDQNKIEAKIPKQENKREKRSSNISIFKKGMNSVAAKQQQSINVSFYQSKKYQYSTGFQSYPPRETKLSFFDRYDKNIDKKYQIQRQSYFEQMKYPQPKQRNRKSNIDEKYSKYIKNQDLNQKQLYTNSNKDSQTLKDRRKISNYNVQYSNLSSKRDDNSMNFYQEIQRIDRNNNKIGAQSKISYDELKSLLWN